jgi:hypothetical protein
MTSSRIYDLLTKPEKHNTNKNQPFMASTIRCCRQRKRGRPSKAHRDRLKVCIRKYELEKIDTCNKGVSNSEGRMMRVSVLRHDSDMSWQRWKAMHGAENMIKEMTHLERIKLFGGGADEDMSLCEPMLQVVFNLFGGIDYTDP